ncbi:glycoside hydrolase family 3 N-terminal domain-containing protein [Campylobacter porcelli]|uniref:beta-N-acetylhexosaminidase n=1 Tax=Campylobacter porcelli TaxID=1660073 RepID=A0A1X9SWY4_9BACT|nr:MULTISPECIES: glycoside hydrolase family 3 N-terminal domain-containing protein [unclassified Campylobacter]ARR00767.1 glycosyl hydrolase, family 3 [Campylobacter sp. RM6137]
MRKIILLFIFTICLFGNSSDKELRNMIGQMIMVGFSGNNANDEWVRQLRLDIKNGRIGGVMILARNISSKDGLKNLISYLNSARPKQPLFIAIDEEGGEISRFNKFSDFEHFPSAYKVGNELNLSSANKLYSKMAMQLKSLGVNMNFAPVVDLHNDISPIIGQRQRAFSSDASEVTAYASEFISAFDNYSVASVLKHFPGHGNAAADTHKTKTIVDNFDFDEIRPYYELIKRKKAKFVMVGHMIIPVIDDTNPATLSYQVVTNLLKDSLAFEGVVISDDMLMKALGGTLEENAIKAIKAGVDIVLVSEYFYNKTNSIKAVNDAIFNAVKSGQIEMTRIVDAYNRIIAQKARF